MSKRSRQELRERSPEIIPGQLSLVPANPGLFGRALTDRQQVGQIGSLGVLRDFGLISDAEAIDTAVNTISRKEMVDPEPEFTIRTKEIDRLPHGKKRRLLSALQKMENITSRAELAGLVGRQARSQTAEDLIKILTDRLKRRRKQ